MNVNSRESTVCTITQRRCERGRFKRRNENLHVKRSNHTAAVEAVFPKSSVAKFVEPGN